MSTAATETPAKERINIDDFGSFPFSSSWSVYLKPPANSPSADYVTVYPEGYKRSVYEGGQSCCAVNLNQGNENQSNTSERDTLFLTKIADIKGFWQLYHSLPPPSLIKHDTDYLLLREDVSPFAEDACNDFGGKWTVQLPAKKTDSTIDNLWLYLMLHAVGEAYDRTSMSTDIAPDLPALTNGVSIAIRQNFFLLSIWVKPQLESFFEPTDGIEMIKHLGIVLKTDILGHPIGRPLTVGNPGYTTEVEFQRHIRGKSKKALKKTRITVE